MTSTSCARIPSKHHLQILGLPCNKTGRWPALFLTLSLTLWRSLHYITLLYITLGRSFITLHYSTLLWGGLSITFHYSTLLGTLFFTFTLHVCALWWQVVISLSRLLCGIQPLWLCRPYHDLLCVLELLSCHSLSVRTVVTPFSILWESSMTCAVRTLCFLAAALSNSMCALLYTTLFSTLGLRPYSTLCAPYSTRPYSLLYSMCALLYTTLFSTLLYVHLTLLDPILGCALNL